MKAKETFYDRTVSISANCKLPQGSTRTAFAVTVNT